MIRLGAGVLFAITLLMAGQLLFAAVAVMRASQDADPGLLDLAVQVDTANPHVLSILAARSADDDTRVKVLRALVVAEPRRGEAWSQLFQQKVRMGQVDDEASNALVQSAALSPYEPGVLYQQVLSGMDGWFQLDPAHRRMVVDAGSRILLSRAVHLKEESLVLMRGTGLLPMSCSQVHDVPACHGN